MTVRRLLDRGIIFFVLVLCLLSCALVLAKNGNITVNIKAGIPVTIYYNGNKSLNIESSRLLTIPQPVSVCLKQFYKACIRINGYDQLYISSMSTNNSLVLFASNINITVHEVSVVREKLASGEALLMLIEFENNTILNASLESVYLLSRGIKRDITNIASLKTEDNSLYLGLNYEKGRLPFIEFHSNDTVEASLYVNKGILKLVLILEKKTGTNENVGGSYTRVVGTNNTSYSSVSIYTSIMGNTLNRNPMVASFIKLFLDPLFIFATILLFLSFILWARINNTLNK